MAIIVTHFRLLFSRKVFRLTQYHLHRQFECSDTNAFFSLRDISATAELSTTRRHGTFVCGQIPVAQTRTGDVRYY